MAKHIDADAFRNYLKMMQEANKDNHKEYVYYLGYAIEHLNDFTEVEGIEIVRCKDCDWYREDDSICVNPHCSKSFYGCRVREQHFCSYGERKDNETV